MAIRNVVMVMTSDYLLLHGGATNGWRAMRGYSCTIPPMLDAKRQRHWDLYMGYSKRDYIYTCTI